ncbi:MAG: hypothetical protein E7462_04175 [Ruminococcaceae bacterium]|nr:hypothetical protein [Oscillospiraceae bacterium]
MEAFINQVKAVLADEQAMTSFLIMAAVLTVGSLVFGFIGRFVFGKKSVLNQSVSSAIGILFIYAVTVTIHSFGLDLKFLVSPLPFVTIAGDSLIISNFTGVDYTVICNEVLNMVILAFLANLANSWLPTGKRLISWLLFRILSVASGMIMFAIVNYLLTTFLPEGLLTWAPVILLCLLGAMLLLGALKGIVGALLTTVSPVIGLLYTFFFATVVGKMISRAVLTTLIMTALIYALNFFEIFAVAIGAAVLVTYLPLMILLLALWYIVGKLL